MSTDLAASVGNLIRERVIEACADEEVCGVTGWKNGRDFVLLLQAYSDKSCQTLKSNAAKHLPLHAVLVNTSLKIKEQMVCAGDSVIGYLPTEMRWKDPRTKMWTTTLPDAASVKGSRASRLRIFQDSIRVCLGPLLDLTVNGFPAVDSVGRVVRCHPVLW